MFLRKITLLLIAILLLPSLTGCEILPHRHRYLGETKIASSCENTGIKEYKCEYCDDTYTEILPILWHTPNSAGNCIRCNRVVAIDLNFYLNETGEGYIISGNIENHYYNTELIIPSYHNNIPVTQIADNAFSNGAYTNIKISPTIKIIDRSAFSNTINFSKLYIYSDNLIIKPYAFENCITLNAIYIMGSINSVEENAFSNCLSLSKIHFYGTSEQFNSITVKLGNDAFINAEVEYHLP